MKLHIDSIQLEFGDRKILQDVFLQCTRGEIVGLLGRNGCGKSSLLRIVFGVLSCQFKHVNINGQFIGKGYHNHRIAYLPQHNYLPKNIAIHLLAKHLVDEALWPLFAAQPAFQKHQHVTPAELSGGELRQLETLMIICSRADFILLDEPFTHVSPIQTNYLKQIIQQVSPLKGFIITDHQYQNVLDISNRVILLANGRTIPIHHRADLVTHNYLLTI